MTDILFREFKEKFPEINGYNRVIIYEAYERIYLDLIAREFVDAREFDDLGKIKDLASIIFDVNFFWGHTYYGSKEAVPTIIFSPIILPRNKGGTEELMSYHNHYSGHSIEIKLPAPYPMVTISTGNRGRVDLLDKQREKYFDFVNRVYDLFLENAR